MKPNEQLRLALPPLALYIHIPWCVRKCPYCDFNSHESKTIPEQAYVDCLLDDLSRDVQLAQGRPISSIFFGGGTPSLFSPDAIARLLDGAAKLLSFADDIEITLEANPGTVEQARFHGFRNAGINRLSLGIQSFNPKHLKALGRIHDDQDAHRAITAAYNAGLDNINLDLMFGLPEQSLAEALEDLTTACTYQPTHLSWYQLTIEPNTVFYNRPPLLPDDDSLWDIQSAGQHLLAAQGFRQYEISAYARDNKQCRHNLNYWQFGDYLAIGAGAHGKITVPESDSVLRFQKTRLPRDYMNPDKAYESERRMLNAADVRFEFLLNAMRLVDGASMDCFTSRTGLPIAALSPELERAQSMGLIETINGDLRPTATGLQYLNDLLGMFLPDS